MFATGGSALDTLVLRCGLIEVADEPWPVSVFWIRTVLFAAMTASMASYPIVDCGRSLGADGHVPENGG